MKIKKLVIKLLPFIIISLNVSFLISGTVFAAQGDTIRVSVNSSGIESETTNRSASISPEGRYVAFDTDANNLVTEDWGYFRDVFVHDTLTGKTTRVSVDSSGVQGHGSSGDPSISSAGRYIVFESLAINLVAGDTNNTMDIFMHDSLTGETTRVSVNSSGVEGNFDSFHSSISSDGRYVAFVSNATNLVEDDTNDLEDIFVHDTLTGRTTRVSVDSSGVEGNGASIDPSISSDGRYVAFVSNATNLVKDDTNDLDDVFMHDTLTGKTTRVSVNSSGVQANGQGNYPPSISPCGRYIAFDSRATNLVIGDTSEILDIFVHDSLTGETTRVSVDSSGVEGNGASIAPSISSDGRYVAFFSYATNFVEGDSNNTHDVFVHDTLTGRTTRVSVDSSGIEGNGFSAYPSISSDGRYVAFSSIATNLVTGDTNSTFDIFVHNFLDKVSGSDSRGFIVAVWLILGIL